MKNQIPSFLRNSIFLVLVVLVFSSCAQSIPVEEFITAEPYRFWGGLLHGFISPFSFIGSLFDENIAVYAINNNGTWYDFGFLLGAATIFGGSGNKAKSK